MKAEIRRCREEDLFGVMEFIDAYWIKDHILFKHRELMDWQYGDPKSKGTYNWLIAEDEEGTQGILGFIPTFKYDPDLAVDPLTWLALWKIRPQPKNHTLGLRLMSTLAQAKGTGKLAVLGINSTHAPMYKALGYVVGDLKQHFTCNPNLAQTLIGAPDDFEPPQPLVGRATFREVDAIYLDTFILVGVKVPCKSPRYFLNRYLIHPIYQYRIFAIELDGCSRALLSMRIASNNGARVLRIVDFLGDEEVLAESGSAIGQLLDEEGCEYADFLEYGLLPSVLVACGFRQAIHGSAVVVPNYFEPFLRRSTRIQFAIKGVRAEDLAIFRGDGDQDRPNQAPSTPSDIQTMT